MPCFTTAYLTATRFTLTLTGDDMEPFKGMSFKFDMPRVSVGPIEQSAPLRNIPHYGTKIVYDDLSADLKVDPELGLYEKLLDWMTQRDEDIYRDAIVTFYNNNEQPTKNVFFKNVFPTSLSLSPFDSTDQNDTEASLSVTFSYDEFELQDT